MKHHVAKKSFEKDSPPDRGVGLPPNNTLSSDSADERAQLAEELALCLSVQAELNASILRRVLLLVQVQVGEENFGPQEAALARLLQRNPVDELPTDGDAVQTERTREALRAEDGERLSVREGEVLRAVALSKSNKETGRELGISFKTVEKQRQAVMNKLDIHDVAGLTRFAIEKGVI